jgi:hypothetical protein
MSARSSAAIVFLLACATPWVLASARQSRMDKATAASAAQESSSGGASPSQSRMDKATAASAAQEGASAGRKTDSAEASTAMPATPSEVVLSDSTTRQKYLISMQRYYEYRTDGYAYRSRLFEWQLFSSRAIFVVVLALVGAGMYFAAVQFRAAMAGAPQPDGGKTSSDAGKAALDTKLEVSAKGLVVNSSVLGVIILSLSLAFFYLYLVYVYPIQNVF